MKSGITCAQFKSVLADGDSNDAEIDCLAQALDEAVGMLSSRGRVALQLKLREILADAGYDPDGQIGVGKFDAGQRVKFTYPDYGNPNIYLDHVTHSGQEVTVVRQLAIGSEVDEEVGVMYAIKADDGWEGTVYEDELAEL